VAALHSSPGLRGGGASLLVGGVLHVGLEERFDEPGLAIRFVLLGGVEPLLQLRLFVCHDIAAYHLLPLRRARRAGKHPMEHLLLGLGVLLRKGLRQLHRVCWRCRCRCMTCHVPGALRSVRAELGEKGIAPHQSCARRRGR
jgi:hypothetical protein